MTDWKSTSASQTTTFSQCPRAWYYGSVQKVSRVQTKSQELGEDIHSGTEIYLGTGVIPDGEVTLKPRMGKPAVKKNLAHTKPYVQALVPILPKPMTPELVLEHEFVMKLPQGIVWRGFIDFADSAEDALIINDLKTTSDLRYAKTPKELAGDIQMLSYAQYGYSIGHKGDIDLRHVYVHTKLPKTKLPNVLGPISAIVDQTHVETAWNQTLLVVDEMMEAALATDAQDVAPKGTQTGHCNKYGGCPFKSECFGSGTLSLFSSISKKPSGSVLDMSDFLKKMRELQAKNGKGEAPTVPKISVPTGTLSDDAPSREYTAPAADTAVVTEEPKKRGRPKKEAASKIQEIAAKVVDTEDAVGKSPFYLYIDCAPQKLSRDDLPPTLFEDWFAGVVAVMNEKVRADKNLSDYRLLAYSEEKALLASAVAARAELDLPEHLLVSSSSPGARDALGVLIPHATQVYRSYRA